MKEERGKDERQGWKGRREESTSNVRTIQRQDTSIINSLKKKKKKKKKFVHTCVGWGGSEVDVFPLVHVCLMFLRQGLSVILSSGITDL